MSRASLDGFNKVIVEGLLTSKDPDSIRSEFDKRTNVLLISPESILKQVKFILKEGNNQDLKGSVVTKSELDKGFSESEILMRTAKIGRLLQLAIIKEVKRANLYVEYSSAKKPDRYLTITPDNSAVIAVGKSETGNFKILGDQLLRVKKKFYTIIEELAQETTPKGKKKNPGLHKYFEDKNLKRLALSTLKNLQKGHLHGPAATVASDLRSAAISTKIFSSIGIKGRVLGHTQEILKIEAKPVYKRTLRKGKEYIAENNVGLILELKTLNEKYGRAVVPVLRRLRNLIRDNAFKNSDVQRAVNNFANLKGSPSSINIIFRYLKDLFKVGKSKDINETTKGTPLKRELKTEKGSIRPLALDLVISRGGSDEVDYNSHITKLNARLHDKIQQNMGKGGSKQKLNYRTGRFARSARIEAFTNSSEKNAVNAAVKYMKDPYSIFEPGGKLHKGLVGRDPHLIFGRSIRQLLQEEKIATLRRVKVELRG